MTGEQLPGDLGLADFDEFFAALNDGHAPFTWQRDLVEHVLSTGTWPDRIVAPTGSGKSSVVEVHIFANACAAAGGLRVPRRLHVVVNRRALVDNQADRAEQILARLREDPEEPILERVAALLSSLRVDDEAPPFEVGHLRGQLPDRSIPIDDPSACAVIASTPDMWGSRLLFRGYGSSRHARPRETAMVATDSVLVLDEAHLNRQLLVTARRVAELQKQEEPLGVPTLQVTETTATSAGDGDENATAIGVDPVNLDHPRDAALRQRLRADKALRLVDLPRWTGRPAQPQLVATAIEHIQRQMEEFGPTVGCIVNHVDTALKITSALRKAGLEVVLLVGRRRPADVSKIRQEYPGLLTPEGNERVDVVVATQTLEVGVDMDFSALVTELAPGSALTQRCGRVNRLGRRPASEVVILRPESQDLIRDEHPPYAGADLVQAFEWLTELESAGSINPEAVIRHPAPAESPRRLLFQRPELSDLRIFARTSDRIFAEPDLTLWLRDSLDPDQALAGIVVRDRLPRDDAAALELLKALPPTSEEAFPANLRIVRGIHEKLVVPEGERFRLELKDKLRRRAFLYRENEITLLSPGDQLRPGDTVIIDRGLSFTTEQVATDKPSEPAPEQVDLEGISNPHVLGEKDTPEKKEWFRRLVGLTPDEATEAWNEEGNTGELVVSSTILDDHGRDAVAWFFVLKDQGRSSSPEVRQEWTVSAGKVGLDAHQQAVAERTHQLCSRLGITETVGRQVVTAAQHHDDGKADPRFQRMLGAGPSDELLAKSGYRTRQQVRLANARSGLPTGWRHEQYSVVLIAHLMRDGQMEHSDLALRIVGTSHGRGRSGFPHTGEDLLPVGTEPPLQGVATDFFTTGFWDQLIAETDRRFGCYSMAFLESLERAADAQISSEGR